MTKFQDSAVGLFANHHGFELEVKELQKSGYDMKKMSVVGKDYQAKENVVGEFVS